MKLSKWALDVVKRMPKNTLSRAFGAVSEMELPGPAQRAVNRAFAAALDIDTAEAEAPPEEYESLNDYFTRRLSEEARSVRGDDSETLISPVDGTVEAMGDVQKGMLFQAKGRDYRLLDLVDSAAVAEWFSGGAFATFYLSPRDYHRVHSPVDGRVFRLSYIPGHLFPVNPLAARNIDNLFAVNERLITYLETERFGRVGLVKVGATCVGRISPVFDDFETNRSFRRRREFEPEDRVELRRGDELAVFNLGSSVVLLVEEPDCRFVDDLEIDQTVRMGQPVARLEV